MGQKNDLRQTPHLAPPFSKDTAIRLSQCSTSLDALFPPYLRHGDQLCDTRKDVDPFLNLDLRTPTLIKIHRYLWLAGLPRPARPIHLQRLLGRVVHLTKNPDEHLLWHESSIHEFRKERICQDDKLYRSAYGILLYYAWLVGTRSDIGIARDTSLVPSDVEWDFWTALIRDVLHHEKIRASCEVDSRYAYGELWLSRLNSLYQFGAPGLSLQNLVFGYMSGSQRYTAFFGRNFGWLFWQR
ncbi:uncharacterized protein LY79DRAFT_594637 [Colletotrichum navitas]|uniref:Uncharacterized protein n=1 Tax=Colletotrichum navitas TaxID=681940 RepID=A0AAD8PLE5_9PEZI|nr:uncharacterized protein LY79DRAFT_594637 [Colletotrichum navitas]KAK1569876.1 hypothetical protein LY79DRAFT_594637 [Colletotrichum navitas]